MHVPGAETRITLLQTVHTLTKRAENVERLVIWHVVCVDPLELLSPRARAVRKAREVGHMSSQCPKKKVHAVEESRQLILADDVRMASLEALLPSDLEKDSRRTCCYVKKSCPTARQEAWCMKDLEDITRLPCKLTASGRKEHKGQRQEGRCWQAME